MYGMPDTEGKPAEAAALLCDCGISKMPMRPSAAPHTAGWPAPSLPHEAERTLTPALVNMVRTSARLRPSPVHWCDSSER